MSDPEQAQRGREQQRELYGEPLDALVGRVAGSLGITQGRLAEALGLSPAMLSQLRSAQRVKIGNPAVLERLRALDEVAAGGAPEGEALDALLAAVRARTGYSSWTARVPRPADPGHGPATTATDARTVVHALQDLLRAVAPADELLAAAALLQDQHPAVAELLRVYGAGRTDAAQAHYERTTR